MLPSAQPFFHTRSNKRTNKQPLRLFQILCLFAPVTHHAAMLPVAHATQGDEKNHLVLHTCMISPFFTPVGLA